MKKLLVVVCLAAVLGLLGSTAWAGTAREDSVERLKLSTDVLTALMATPDNGIPEEVLDSAKCMIVVPHLIKGGFVFGAKHGRGIATCRTSSGWSAPAFVSVGGGSWGLQIGVEGIDLVMLIMNDQGTQHLLSSKFKISGEGSAAAGPVGRHASVGTDWKLNTEMLTYSRAKGVFAGLTLEGAVVQQDDDSTRAIYGKKIPFKRVLAGKTMTPAVAEEFMKAVSNAGKQARVAEVKDDAKK
ncbi:MAG TPA: lipid-binding SYLF domain-containing protein [Terriglobales bacterium]|nr:lipid-binding SYLF domain-containing protein [Terriglobales bacterium]